MFQLVQPQLFFLFLKDKFFPFKLVLQLFSFPFKSSDLLVALLLDFGSLVFQLFDLILKLWDGLLADFFIVGFFLFQFILNLPDFFFLDNILLMQFPDLFFFVIDGLNLFFGFLAELL